MNTIWKYTITGNGTHRIPKGAKVIHVGNQNGYICIWCEVDTGVKVFEKRDFKIFGTGRKVEGKHCGTVIMGDYVWHVYEV